MKKELTIHGFSRRANSYLAWRIRFIKRYGEIAGKAKILQLYNKAKSAPGKKMDEVREKMQKILGNTS